MMKKQTLVATAFVSLMTASVAFAACDGAKNKGNGGYRHGHSMGYKKLNMDRTLNKEQVRTLQEARLIVRNNPNIKVGHVTATDSGFTVTIVTQDNSLVKTLTLAKNGMRQDRYDRIQLRRGQTAN